MPTTRTEQPMDAETQTLALELSAIANEPSDSDDSDDEIEDEEEGVPGFASERIDVDASADLEIEDATLEWSQGDEDLGDEGGN